MTADSHAAFPEIADGSPSEHIYIASDDSEPATAGARTVRAKHAIANVLRRSRTELTLYAEGALRVIEYRGGKRRDSYLLDLRYLDPVPQITRITAKRAVQAAFGLAALAASGLSLARLGVAPTVTVSAAFGFAGAALGATLAALYRSYEKIVFHTIHGRAPVLTLRANVGSLRHAHALIPALAQAIEETAETIGADTSAFLRAEMREHYRLRSDGVLSNDSCADSTGRILAQFDVQL
jgi:hypothetical protein